MFLLECCSCSSQFARPSRGNHKGLEGVRTRMWALCPTVTWPRTPHTARKPTSSFLPCISTPLLITRFLRISLSGSNKNT